MITFREETHTELLGKTERGAAALELVKVTETTERDGESNAHSFFELTIHAAQIGYTLCYSFSVDGLLTDIFQVPAIWTTNGFSDQQRGILAEVLQLASQIAGSPEPLAFIEHLIKGE